MNAVKKVIRTKKIISAQGPASLAIEIGLLNFVRGKVLVVSTGFYSDRLYSILKMSKKKYNFIKKLTKLVMKI